MQREVSLLFVTVLILLTSIPTEAQSFRSFLKQTNSHEQLALNQHERQAFLSFDTARVAPHLRLPSTLGSVDVHINSRGQVFLDELPDFKTDSVVAGRFAANGPDGEYVVFTADRELQNFVQKTVKDIRASHAAIVLMEPRSGRVLALADKSNSLDNAALHAGFPAASLFKVVTSAAALEQTQLEPESKVRFRGGNYTLNKYNYAPSSRYDKRSMTLEEALGKSCNAVFARVALQHLSQNELHRYANLFGFNRDLAFDAPGLESSATIPESNYELSRTAAGFGDVFISPVHAAAFMSAVANGGFLPRPHVIDRIISQKGHLLYRAKPAVLQRVIASDTANTLLEMMEATTTKGTSAYAFYKKKRPLLSVRVSGKTGTLTGKNPKGLNKWFVGTAPLESPEVSIAVLINNPRNSAARASYIARKVLQEYFAKNDSPRSHS